MARYVTKAEHRRRAERALEELGEAAPEGWLQLDPGPGARERVTLRLPAEVLAYFRAFGPGYQKRIALVLSAWASGRQGLRSGAAAGPAAEDEVSRWFTERRDQLDRRRAELRRQEADRAAEAAEHYRQITGEE